MPPAQSETKSSKNKPPPFAIRLQSGTAPKNIPSAIQPSLVSPCGLPVMVFLRLGRVGLWRVLRDCFGQPFFGIVDQRVMQEEWRNHEGVGKVRKRQPQHGLGLFRVQRPPVV